jgi:hypothetical protein
LVLSCKRYRVIELRLSERIVVALLEGHDF